MKQFDCNSISDSSLIPYRISLIRWNSGEESVELDLKRTSACIHYNALGIRNGWYWMGETEGPNYVTRPSYRFVSHCR